MQLFISSREGADGFPGEAGLFERCIENAMASVLFQDGKSPTFRRLGSVWTVRIALRGVCAVGSARTRGVASSGVLRGRRDRGGGGCESAGAEDV